MLLRIKIYILFTVIIHVEHSVGHRSKGCECGYMERSLVGKPSSRVTTKEEFPSQKLANC
jgi:hypothetical protein